MNLLEPGDEFVVGVNGVFGSRMAEVAERAGAIVHRVEAPWGRIVRAGADRGGARERDEAEAGRGRACRDVHRRVAAASPRLRTSRIAHGALMLIDCVTSLGGAPVEIDGWGVDAAYSGTQKCLSCPPGLAPVTFGPARRRRDEGPQDEGP